MKREHLTPAILLIILSLLIFTVIPYQVHAPPPITQETIVVDINGNGDYTTIQEAITNASATDIILIQEGTYIENNLVVDKKINIVGESSSTTIIDCNGENGLILQSKHVEISNLKIINAKEYAIQLPMQGGFSRIESCNIIKSTSGIGIWIQSPSNVISDCELIGKQPAIGVQIRRDRSIVEDSTLQGFDVAILVTLNSYLHEIKNCNIFNNNFGIDIRLSSYSNTITGCNIYSNIQGIYIWQGSSNNTIYLNNFFRNDEDAKDENINNWDDGSVGNYWDDYTGVDTNGDGIGDTSYRISANNYDRYPYLTMILPDIITVPSSLKHISSISDPTPSFTWSESGYSKGISGYYVKIDNSPETFIGDTTSWTSLSSVSDGVHTFYVRAESTDGKFGNYATLAFSIDTTFADSDEDGWSDQEEIVFGTDPNNSDNYPLDTDGDRIPDSIDQDNDNDGYADEMEASYGTDGLDSEDYPIDYDGDGTPDADSPDGAYTGDADNDNDGLEDVIEIQLGSNPLNPEDITIVYLKGSLFYLVDISESGKYDVLYNPRSETTTAIELDGDYYLIDSDGDGTWDLRYGVQDGVISTIQEPSILTYLIWIIPIITLLVLIILFYKGKLKLPIKKRKASSLKPIRLNKDTKSMVTETRTLHENIQHEISTFIEQIKGLEGRIDMLESISDEDMTVGEIENKYNALVIRRESLSKKIDKPKSKVKATKKREKEPLSKEIEETDLDIKDIEKIVDEKEIEETDLNKKDIEKRVDKLLSK
jgi:parallel beta-helix repeat protein